MKKTVIITGANSGLGFETARKVAARPDFKVILACRNQEKAAAAREKIVAGTGNGDVCTLPIDTSSLSSVRAFADAVIASGEKVYALVNNAGIPGAGPTIARPCGFRVLEIFQGCRQSGRTLRAAALFYALSARPIRIFGC